MSRSASDRAASWDPAPPLGSASALQEHTAASALLSSTGSFLKVRGLKRKGILRFPAQLRRLHTRSPLEPRQLLHKSPDSGITGHEEGPSTGPGVHPREHPQPTLPALGAASPSSHTSHAAAFSSRESVASLQRPPGPRRGARRHLHRLQQVPGHRQDEYHV